jgi:nitroreductase
MKGNTLSMTTLDMIPLRKPAETEHPVHELISERWSPRAFAERPVEREKLRSLFEAARWAPSGGNKQPWNFLFATQEDAEAHARLGATLNEGNIIWAQHAPVLILVVAKLYEYAGKEQFSFYDVGMASGNLMAQAIALGLTTHQMGGFDADKARRLLDIPEGYQPLAMIALGYPGLVDTLPETLREREVAPRVRKPQNEFVFEGRWQKVLR